MHFLHRGYKSADRTKDRRKDIIEIDNKHIGTWKASILNDSIFTHEQPCCMSFCALEHSECVQVPWKDIGRF